MHRPTSSLFLLRSFIASALALALLALPLHAGKKWIPWTTAAAPGGGPTLVISDATSSGGANGTSLGAAIDTTGVNFLAVIVSSYAPGSAVSFSDSKSNTWSNNTSLNSSNVRTTLYYCYNPTVGSGHDFTVTGTNTYASIIVLGFAGVAASPFDGESAGGVTNSSWTNLATGSDTPSQANILWITGGTQGGIAGSGMTVDSGFSTPLILTNVGSTRICSYIAWKSVSSASAVNATWTAPTSASEGAVFLASFKW